MHQKNSNHVGSCHVEGFQDWSMYKEKKVGLGIDTWDETPCTVAKLRHQGCNLELGT